MRQDLLFEIDPHILDIRSDFDFSGCKYERTHHAIQQMRTGRQLQCPVEHHPDRRLASPMPHGQRRIVQQRRTRPDHNGRHFGTKPVNSSERLGRRQKHRGFSSILPPDIHKAICALGPFQIDIRAFPYLESHKSRIQGTGLFFQHSRHDFDTCLAQHTYSPPRHFWKRIQSTDHNTRDTFLYNQLRTGRCLSVMRTGLEAHIDSGIPQKRFIPDRGHRIHFGMRFAAFTMKAFSYNLPFMHYHRTDHRVRSRITFSSPCKLDAAGHIFLFDNHLLLFFIQQRYKDYEKPAGKGKKFQV